jgi:hypothetical protein
MSISESGSRMQPLSPNLWRDCGHVREFCLTLYVGASILCGLVGLAIARWWPGADAKDYLATPETFIWVGMITAQAAVWPLIFIHLLGKRRSWSSKGDRAQMLQLLIPTLLIVASLVSAAYTNRTIDSPLRWQHLRVVALTLLGLLAISPGLMTVFEITRRATEKANRLSESPPIRAPDRAMASEVLRMRKDLSQILFTLVAVIGIATLTTGALRNAALAVPNAPRLPTLYPLLYGALLTGILALMFVPAHWATDRYAQAVLDSVCPLPRRQPTPEWFSGYANLSAHLRIGSGAADALKDASAILAPLVASVLTALANRGS